MQIIFFLRFISTYSGVWKRRDHFPECYWRGRSPVFICFFILASLSPRGNWENCVSHLFQLRRSIPSILPGPRERPPANTEEDVHGFEPWTMGGETMRRREGKMQGDKKVRERGVEGRGRARGVKKERMIQERGSWRRGVWGEESRAGGGERGRMEEVSRDQT